MASGNVSQPRNLQKATPPNYGLGWLIVAGTVLASFLLCFGMVGPRPTGAQPRAGRSFQSNPLPLGKFQFTERSGQTVSQDNLSDQVWIAAFIFTRCPSSCPRISSTMKGLQGKLQGTGVRLVSISVDPAHDSPEVLARYAEGLGADKDAWWFLTGDHDATFALIRNGFLIPVEDASPEQVAQGMEDVAHSSKLALVDRENRVVGFFGSDEAEELEALIRAANRLDNVWGHRLPILNAVLNSSCAVVLLIGWGLIMKRKWRAHAVAMITALALSAIFLTCYLVYHFVVVKGSVPFQGVGRPIRILYFGILLSHTILALVLVPLILMTVFRVWKRKFDAHARLAQITFPIWLYVSITGVVVYWMLYQMDFSKIAQVVQ